MRRSYTSSLSHLMNVFGSVELPAYAAITRFKSLIKQLIRHCGFDLKRHETEPLITMLEAHDVNLVFDVGANEGQYGRLLRDAGYRGRIVSFEPLAAAWSRLSAVSSSDPLWEVAPQAAIGSEDGDVELHVAGNSLSSSVLDMLETHSKAAPESAYVGVEKVPLRRLDTLASDCYLRPDDVLFINVDTQGYEDRVLQGAPESLARAVGLQLELSLVPLYDGAGLYDELTARLKVLGFELWGIAPVFYDPGTGRLLQVDATFFRP